MSDAIDCTECKRWFCDNCYDCEKGDGCKCHTAYPGTMEVVPGVFIDFEGETPAVYIADKHGEIVTWNFDEVKEDPGAWTASLMGVILAAKCGASANREVLETPASAVEVLRGFAQTSWVVLPPFERKVWGVLEQFLVDNVRFTTYAEARRVISQGGVTVNSAVIRNPSHSIQIGDTVTLRKTTYVVPS